MTVRSHLAEIFRQGLWASLTGGWFYDPGQSLFCNTVHLYMWLVLLLLPLLFSLATAGSPLSWALISTYVIVVIVIFAVLKALVWYIHGIFDKNDPILITKADSETAGGHSRQLSIVTEGMRTDATSDDPANEIEMVEFGSSRRDQPPLSTSAPGIYSGESAEDVAAVIAPEVTKRTRRSVRIVDNNVCGGDMAVVADVHLRPSDSIKLDEEHNSEEDDRSSGPPSDKALLPKSASSAIMIPADSLELLPIGTRRQSDADTRKKTTITRKLSEPSFDVYQNASLRSRRARRRSSDSEQPTRSVRRARSSLETANAKQRHHSQSFVLSQRTLDECKNTTRKSYPSKTSSTDIFLTSGLRPNQEQADDLSSANSSGLKLTLDVGETAHYGGSDPVIVEENEPESSEKSANESQDEADDAKNLEVFLENIREKMESMAGAQGDAPTAEPEESLTPSKQRSMTPDLAWLFRERSGSDTSQRKDRESRPDRPAIDAQSPIPPTTVSPPRRQRAIRGESEPRPGTSTGPSSSDVMDLKGEIARLLEELIEKHPETLDAIESVRQSRLGRSAGDSRRRHRYMSTEEHGRRRSERAASLEPPPAALAALSDLSMRSGTHVATNHEDTSQGAIHSFQDEDGNWFTYSFDELGVGTAQALGSSRALMEMLHAQPRQTLTALPETGFTETESDDDLEMGKSQRQGRRTNSSSSNDSATYMAELPVSILHPSSASQASRDAPPFANVAARLRHAARRSGRDQSTAASRLQQMMERAVAVAAAHQLGGGGTVTSPADYSSATLGISRSIQTSSMGSGSSLNRIRFLTDLTGMSAAGTSVDSRRVSAKRKYYYRLMLCPKFAPGRTFKLQMDRLRLLALFDRNASLLSAAFDVFMAALVSVLAALLLSRGLFVDQWLVLFCFVVAGAQFSLLKSVQPDAASPIHGYNWLVAYGRPAYLCMLAVVLLAVEADWWNHKEAWYSIAWAWNPYRFDSTALPVKMAAVRDFLVGLILLLPVAFTVGLLPQVNTFLMHLLEQVDMHLFGGTASFGLLSATYNLGKSVLSSALLFALCQTALNWAGESTQSVLFSAFCAVLVSLSYLLSRSSSSPALLWCAVHEFVRKDDGGAEKDTNELVDPLPGRLKDTVSVRLKHDLLMSTVAGLLMFGLHCTSIFTATQPYLHYTLVGVAVSFGFVNHYVFPQLRKQTPFKLVARPILKAHEYGQFETAVQAKLMFFEKVHVWMRVFERNVVYPILVVGALTVFAPKMTPKWLVPIVLPVIGLRLLRGGFCHPQLVYIPLLGSSLLLTLDLGRHHVADYFPLCFYAFVAVWPKVLELVLKLEFVLAYIAPWQISWGSAFHAFAQPFSIPHSALTWVQAFLSSVISAPLNPFLGSSFFLTSYVRPVKFWEKDYNTRRVDHSNTRLINQIDRGPMMDDSNLNAVFYEHLTRSLQRSLAGDLELGRWATSVAPGDCFILASYYLNCLVHIIEVGNGFVTFQLRGLEFRGTYCHQREVEAISEDITEGTGCCCCEPGSLPGFLSLNTAWTLRWLAWEVTAAKYVVEGYSITDNSAVNLLQVHELRRLLVTLYVKCIIYYASMSPKLEEWLCTEAVTAAVEPIMANARFVDLDPMFCSANDEDFDTRLSGVSKTSFCDLYRGWVGHCVERRQGSSAETWMSARPESLLVSFCYALSLVGRRALGQAAHNRHANAAESFLYGLHALFKGDFRITSQRDEWVFADMDLLRCVIAPAVRMALKLHQDHFTAPDDFDDSASLFDRITGHESKLFISHEHDPLWRQAILANTPSLLALRHVFDDGQDDYKVIMLNRKYLNFRVIKLNRECVRAFWAGQQQELIFLRNRNPERGSIQNARQVLRNMINSSADQPIGYPIYVSPLTSSFVESHPQVGSVAGPPITLDLFWKGANRLWVWMRKHFGTSGSSNISLPQTAMAAMPARLMQQQAVVETPVRHMDDAAPMPPVGTPVALAVVQSARASVGARGRADQLQTHPIRRAHSHPLRRASPPSVASVDSLRRCRLTELKDSQTAIIKDAEESVVKLEADGTVRVTLHRKAVDEPAAAAESVDEQPQYAEIVDIEHVFKCLDEPLKATGEPLVMWPNEDWRNRGGRSAWDWMPQVGMKGVVVHKWVPFHPERKFRSHAGVIYLLSVRDMSGAYVPVGESGLKIIQKPQYDITNPDWEED